MRRYPSRFSLRDRVEPKFCHLAAVFNMNMRRLAAVAAREEESIPSDRAEIRHEGIVPREATRSASSSQNVAYALQLCRSRFVPAACCRVDRAESDGMRDQRPEAERRLRSSVAQSFTRCKRRDATPARLVARRIEVRKIEPSIPSAQPQSGHGPL